MMLNWITPEEERPEYGRFVLVWLGEEPWSWEDSSPPEVFAAVLRSGHYYDSPDTWTLSSGEEIEEEDIAFWAEFDTPTDETY